MCAQSVHVMHPRRTSVFSVLVILNNGAIYAEGWLGVHQPAVTVLHQHTSGPCMLRSVRWLTHIKAL